MIKEKTEKIEQIISTIETRISEINNKYRKGPGLYFYRKIIKLRSIYKSIKTFLYKKENIEALYATLLSWDMNCRGAKMKYYNEFENNVINCLPCFLKIENLSKKNFIDLPVLNVILKESYNRLDVMLTNSKFVSNAKILHFLFPKLLMPMDGTNTLSYFYKNTGESLNKYIEIINFQFEVMHCTKNLNQYLDNTWNITIPKMIDNSIILIEVKV
ncbi:unnamed protein product, partial [marine sediment metagenome]